VLVGAERECGLDCAYNDRHAWKLSSSGLSAPSPIDGRARGVLGR